MRKRDTGAARARGNMEHAANPGPVGDVCERDGAIPDRIGRRDAHAGRGDAVEHGAKNSEQVDEIADREVVGTRDLRDLGVEADSGTVRKKTIIDLANIDTSAGCIARNPLCEVSRRQFPVEWNVTRFGEIVTGSGRYDPEGRAALRAHDAVGGLMDAAVATGHDDSGGALIDAAAHLFFEITDGPASLYLDSKTGFAQQCQNSSFASACATTTGSRIEKQVNGFCVHWPMLQCGGLFSQNGMRGAGTRRQVSNQLFHWLPDGRDDRRQTAWRGRYTHDG